MAVTRRASAGDRIRLRGWLVRRLVPGCASTPKESVLMPSRMALIGGCIVAVSPAATDRTLQGGVRFAQFDCTAAAAT
ncbi:MAG: hypothetical protein QOF95_916 [Pseudonocardiales bacterium]|nr:hypothetical protein [Pseudonocardiales bacterium]